MRWLPVFPCPCHFLRSPLKEVSWAGGAWESRCSCFPLFCPFEHCLAPGSPGMRVSHVSRKHKDVPGKLSASQWPCRDRNRCSCPLCRARDQRRRGEAVSGSAREAVQSGLGPGRVGGSGERARVFLRSGKKPPLCKAVSSLRKSPLACRCGSLNALLALWK